METLTITNPAALLNFPSTPVLSPSRVSLTKDDVAIKREIIDLKMQELSYNQLVRHFKVHHRVAINKHDIVATILEAGARAKHLNGIYDSMVRDRFTVIEIDEQWQGLSTCYLGIVDKESQYVLKFSRMPDHERESFARELEGLVDVMNSLEVIITDGLPVYRTLVPELFDGIVHVLCHVHSYRIFLKEAAPYHKEAADALKKLNKAKKALEDARRGVSLKRKQLRRLQDKVRRIEKEYESYRAKHGFKKYSRKAPWTPERRDIAKRLNHSRASLRSKKNTVANKKQKVNDLKIKIVQLEIAYKEKKQVSLQTGRLLRWFRRFLSCDQEAFDIERARIIALLDRSTCPMATKMLKYINDNPQLQPATNVDLNALYKGFKASTNMVESFFGIARPLLDKARRFSNSPQSIALLDIFRLQVNLTPPFTGPNKHTTPLERAGIHCRYDHYLDALFPSIEQGTGRERSFFQKRPEPELEHTGRAEVALTPDCPGFKTEGKWLKHDPIAAMT